MLTVELGLKRQLEETITKTKCAATRDFQQSDILTSVDSDEPVQPPFKLRNSKWRSVSNLTLIEYSSGKQRLWSGCTYAQAGLSRCWPHIPHCCKSHVAAQITETTGASLAEAIYTYLQVETQFDFKWIDFTSVILGFYKHLVNLKIRYIARTLK